MEPFVIVCEYKTDIDFGSQVLQVLYDYEEAKKRLVEIIKEEYQNVAKVAYPDITLDEFVDKFWELPEHKDFWEINLDDISVEVQKFFPNKIERYYICTPEITE